MIAGALLLAAACNQGGAEVGADAAVSPTDLSLADLAPPPDLGQPPCTTAAAIRKVATGQTGVWALGFQGEYLYWLINDAQNGAVRRAPIGGGPVENLASGQPGPNGLAFDGDHVYWSNYADGTIWRRPLAGGAARRLASGLAGPSALAVDASFIYYALGNDAPDGAVGKVPIDGGAAISLSQGERNPIALAIDGAHGLLWFINGGSPATGFTDGELRSVVLNGGTPATTVLGALVNPTSIVAVGPAGYFTEFGGQLTPDGGAPDGGSPYTGNVWRVAFADSTVSRTATAQPYPSAIGSDGTSLLWIDAGASEVVRAALDGSGLVPFATMQPGSTALAVGAHATAWGQLFTGDISLRCN